MPANIILPGDSEKNNDKIIVPENQNKEILQPGQPGAQIDKEVDIDKTQFITTFTISYYDWAKENPMGVDKFGNKACDSIAESVRMQYQVMAPTDEVMRFFAMPEKFKRKIDQKNYSVKVKILNNDDVKKVLVLELTLTVNEMVYIPSIIEDGKIVGK